VEGLLWIVSCSEASLGSVIFGYRKEHCDEVQLEDVWSVDCDDTGFSVFSNLCTI